MQHNFKILIDTIDTKSSNYTSLFSTLLFLLWLKKNPSILPTPLSKLTFEELNNIKNEIGNTKFDPQVFTDFILGSKKPIGDVLYDSIVLFEEITNKNTFTTALNYVLPLNSTDITEDFVESLQRELADLFRDIDTIISLELSPLHQVLYTQAQRELGREPLSIYSPYGFNLPTSSTASVFADTCSIPMVIKQLLIDTIRNKTNDTLEITTENYLKSKSNDSYEAIISLPPYSLFMDSIAFADFSSTVLPKSNITVITVPTSMLNGMRGDIYRQKIIKKNILSAVIALPETLFSTTRIGLTILVINQNRQKEQPITFVDFSDNSIKRGSQHIFWKELTTILVNNQDVSKIKTSITPSVVANNSNNITPSLYLKSDKDNPLMSIYNDQIQGSETTIGDIFNIIRPQFFSKKESGNLEEKPVITPDFIPEFGDLLLNNSDQKQAKIIEVDMQLTRINKYLLQKNDIIIIARGSNENIGKVARVGTITSEILASQVCYLLRLKDNKNSKRLPFIYLFLRSKIGQFALNTAMNGNTIKVLQSTLFKKMIIPKGNDTIYKKSEKQLNKINEIQESIKLLQQEADSLTEDYSSLLKG